MSFQLGLARASSDLLTHSLLDAVALAADSIDVHCRWLRTSEHEPDHDAVIYLGPPKYYSSLLESSPATSRISWFGEPLPRGREADARFGHRPGLGRSGGMSAATLRAARYIAGPLKDMSPPGRLGTLREAVAIEHERVTNLAMTEWCRDRGARIVVTSRDRRASLEAAGIAATAVPFGYHPSHAGPIARPDTARDIAAVVVGSGLSSTRVRRGRILTRLRPELQRLGQIVEIDGRWGKERDAILRRARVVVDIQRIPGNFTGLRWLLAAAAGAAYVCEPMDDSTPFQAGVDHVEATPDVMTEVVARLLNDERRRRLIVEESQAMLRGSLAMHRSLERVLVP